MQGKWNDFRNMLPVDSIRDTGSKAHDRSALVHPKPFWTTNATTMNLLKVLEDRFS